MPVLPLGRSRSHAGSARRDVRSCPALHPRSSGERTPAPASRYRLRGGRNRGRFPVHGRCHAHRQARHRHRSRRRGGSGARRRRLPGRRVLSHYGRPGRIRPATGAVDGGARCRTAVAARTAGHADAGCAGRDNTSARAWRGSADRSVRRGERRGRRARPRRACPRTCRSAASSTRRQCSTMRW